MPKLTDDEINRAVAQARGCTVISAWEPCTPETPGARLSLATGRYEVEIVWCIPPGSLQAWMNGDTEAVEWYGVPDVCNDPVVWSDLLIHMSTLGHPGLNELIVGRWQGTLIVGTNAVWAQSRRPGRALALAYLRAIERFSRLRVPTPEELDETVGCVGSPESV